MKIVDTTEYLSVLKELVEEGREVRLKIAGESMVPFLREHRDEVFFRKPTEALKKGDIVFYQREGGQFVMHRIQRVKPEGYFIIGDNQTVVEGPVAKAQIFGVVTKVIRDGVEMGPGDFWWEFFEHVWIRMIPLRRCVMRVYRCLLKIGKGLHVREE
jgi:hypothetical protein